MDGKKLEFKGEEALRELERLTINAREVQETVLNYILSRNRETEYLRKHLKGANDISEFKSRAPIVTYKHVLPYIERISNGEDSSIISGHPIVELLRSSGTTGGEPRLMPSIAEDLDRRTYVYNLLMPCRRKIFLMQNLLCSILTGEFRRTPSRHAQYCSQTISNISGPPYGYTVMRLHSTVAASQTPP